MSQADTSRPRRPRGRPLDTAVTERVAHHAVELLLSRGLHEVALLDVVEAAGVSKAAVYRRWSSLSALWVDLIETSSTVGGSTRAEVEPRRVHRLVELWTGQMRRHELVVAEFAGATHLDPPVATALRRRMDADLAMVLAMAQDCGPGDHPVATSAPVERLARALLVSRLLAGPLQPAVVHFLCDLARGPVAPSVSRAPGEGVERCSATAPSNQGRDDRPPVSTSRPSPSDPSAPESPSRSGE